MFVLLRMHCIIPQSSIIFFGNAVTQSNQCYIMSKGKSRDDRCCQPMVQVVSSRFELFQVVSSCFKSFLNKSNQIYFHAHLSKVLSFIYCSFFVLSISIKHQIDKKSF